MMMVFRKTAQGLDGVKTCGAENRSPRAPAHLDMEEKVKPTEQHGFTLVDFTPDKMVLRQFKWHLKRQAVEAIDTLEPFNTTELVRPT
jgi:hypothetical protein